MLGAAAGGSITTCWSPRRSGEGPVVALLVARLSGSSTLDVHVGQPIVGESFPQNAGVADPVGVRRVAVGELPGGGDVVEGGSSMRTSLRLAPSMVQPIGMP